MKITILGAGAMGCMLAKAIESPGNEVNLVDPYEAHMEKIRKDGIENEFEIMMIGESQDLIEI